jgi:hypothetical protein
VCTCPPSTKILSRAESESSFIFYQYILTVIFGMHRFVPSRVFVGTLRAASLHTKLIKAPPMVYIAGEEMSRWAGELYLNEWIRPFVDISNWEFYDLSCVSRDKSDDKVLADCIAAGKRIGAIYKGAITSWKLTCYLYSYMTGCIVIFLLWDFRANYK